MTFVLVISVAACKSEDVFHAKITFRETETGLSGFDCNEPTANVGDPSPGPLSNRALGACGGPGVVRVVVDVIATDSYVRCDSSSVLDYCENHECVPLARTCFEEPLAPTVTGVAANRAVAAAIEKLTGQVVVTSAPGGYSVVRVIATTQPCSEITQTSALDCTRLLGCSASCPVALDGFTGDLPTVLDLGPAGAINTPLGKVLVDAICAQGVYVCARTPFNRQGQCMGNRTGMKCR
jgi:hypothetical protein